MSIKITIIDYGMGNLHSVKRKLDLNKANSFITSSHKEILEADKVVLVGVGHFKKAMEALYNLDLVKVLRDEVLNKKKPVFGICLGMQLLFSSSEEGGNIPGLNLVEGFVKKLDTGSQKIPHIGFNSVSCGSDSIMMKNIQSKDFYFVHSYCVKNVPKKVVKIICYHNKSFVAAFENQNIWGTQFHPEKSQNNGLLLIKNFLETCKQKKG